MEPDEYLESREGQLRLAIRMIEHGMDLTENGDAAEDFFEVPEYQTMILTMNTLFHEWHRQLVWKLRVAQGKATAEQAGLFDWIHEVFTDDEPRRVFDDNEEESE